MHYSMLHTLFLSISDKINYFFDIPTFSRNVTAEKVPTYFLLIHRVN